MKKGLILIVSIAIFLCISTSALATGELLVNKIKATIEDYEDTQTKNIDDGDTIKTKPNATIEIEVKVKNTWDKDSDTTYEDVSFEVIIEEIDDGDDIEEESDEFDLDPGDSDSESVTINLPLKVDDNTYDMRIIVTGYLNGSQKVQKNYSINLEIEKDSHKIVFTEASLNPQTITCGDTSTLSIELTNIGKSNEDVKVVITNSELNINIQDTFRLDKDWDDDENSQRRVYSIKAPTTAKGSYVISAKAWYNKEKDAISYNPTLKVECAEKTTNVTKTITTNVTPEIVLPGSQDLTGQVIYSTPVPITEKPSWLTWVGDWIMVIILAEIALIIFGLIILIALRKR